MITVTQPDPYVSGGGADGTVDRVVALCLVRTNNASGAAPLGPPDPASSRFDLAELLSWSCRAAGVTSTLPDRSQRVFDHCRTARTLLTGPAEGLATKGCLLFGATATRIGLSLGMRGRAIVAAPDAGGVVVVADASLWDAAARIPGARGYR